MICNTNETRHGRIKMCDLWVGIAITKKIRGMFKTNIILSTLRDENTINVLTWLIGARYTIFNTTHASTIFQSLQTVTSIQ